MLIGAFANFRAVFFINFPSNVLWTFLVAMTFSSHVLFLAIALQSNSLTDPSFFILNFSLFILNSTYLPLLPLSHEP